MRCIPCEMHVYDMHVYEMYAYEMHVYEMYDSDMHESKFDLSLTIPTSCGTTSAKAASGISTTFSAQACSLDLCQLPSNPSSPLVTYLVQHHAVTKDTASYHSSFVYHRIAARHTHSAAQCVPLLKMYVTLCFFMISIWPSIP